MSSYNPIVTSLREGLNTKYTTQRSNHNFTSAATDAEIIASSAGQYINITDLVISTDEAGTVSINESVGTMASTPLIGPLYLAADGGMVSNYSRPLKISEEEANVELTITDSTKVTVSTNYFYSDD